MEYNEEFLKKITQMGTLGYPPKKIINVLDIEDKKKFIDDFKNTKSIIYMHYNRGLDKADFLLDSKLFDMAKNGDLKAFEKYETRKRTNINIGIRS